MSSLSRGGQREGGGGPHGAAEAIGAVDAVYRTESRRVLATLIRLLGDFDLAEEALHDAFRGRDRAMAARRACRRTRGRGWSRPDASRRSTRIRRRARFDARRRSPSGSKPCRHAESRERSAKAIEDDRLRLIFTCCHPALAPDAQVALTLREVCGLTTEEIARAFLTRTADARAAHRAREGQDPRRAHPLPGAGAGRAARAARGGAARDLPRLQRGLLGVLGRLGHARRPVGRGDPPRAAAGRAAARARSDRAARADAAAGVAPRGAHARPTASSCCSPIRTARSGTARRSRRGRRWSSERCASRRFGPYTLQAAIAAVHAEAPEYGTDRLERDRRSLRRAPARRALRPWSSSTARSPSRCATGRQPALR